MADRPPPERTADGRFIVVDGRRWRATDPGIPEDLRVELVAELMSARRDVRTSHTHDVAAALPGDAAQRQGRAQASRLRRAPRPRVGDAKVALGERGDPWWEPTTAGRRERAAAVVRVLLRHRDADATVGLDEVVRVIDSEAGAEATVAVRAVVAELVAAGVVRAGTTEPVRLARGPDWMG